MNENLKYLLEVFFHLADGQPDMPKNDNFFKKPNWFHKYTWTARNEERAVDWISDRLKKYWKGVVKVKPTSKKMRDKIASEFVSNYGLKIRPLTIEDFMPLIPYGQLRETMSKEEFKRWTEWAIGNTESLHGAYRWDVESFLRGDKNLD